MRSYFLWPLIALTLLFGACSSKGHSELQKALSTAVSDEKLSPLQMENILKEYDALRDNDKEKARQYVEQIVTAIEMGADSSHIDVVRKQFIKKTPLNITV